MSADSTAHRTIARLNTLPCTEVPGRRPVRSASANTASAVLIVSSNVVPEPESDPGAWSPSHRTVPCAPTARQLPFHEVSAPVPHHEAR